MSDAVAAALKAYERTRKYQVSNANKLHGGTVGGPRPTAMEVLDEYGAMLPPLNREHQIMVWCTEVINQAAIDKRGPLPRSVKYQQGGG